MTLPDATEALIRRLPKVELHLHIEGTLEPEMVFAKAAKHGVTLAYPSIDALRAAYDFSDLQSFLDIYYAGCDVLRDEQDFYDLCWAYLERAQADNVVHVEIFFDPQTHTARGVSYETVHRGLRRALADGRDQLGISSEMILCFLRHLSEEDAFKTLEEARPFVGELAGVGLDSGERGNPPSKFERVFAAARALGLKTVAHAGEEGPAAYIREALDLLEVVRIDHGVRCDEDPALVKELAAARVPLTVCPLSNVALRTVPDLAAHPLRRMLDTGLVATVNSDDPAYFGGYLHDNVVAVSRALELTPEHRRRLAENSFRASFLAEEDKARHLAAVAASQP
jgi:adenosine deaminase